ncbi:uncharacterized protein KGF55_001170 [Candida pseudojiufengensis]|uniref:uncharacterized protein n=1 Tax=Candida pseudojiufengensis TaxID=497109 RepID=UPI002224D2C8|nr:uncharacterized protein KGF55_001170 [Candida pseudojiufengensis]KAI5965807.1 hypothetical protein KGF55_001170 [Candida pseudojiufengensis]
MVTRNIQRVFILLSCTFLGLICGTLYLYSSYSPQLAKQLGYTVSESSKIALFGTLGASLCGPLSGFVVDTFGYTYSLLIGGILIISGYIGIKYQFDSNLSCMSLTCFWLFNIGSGSTFINSGCLKCCAVGFPSIRGVATSLPLALYGLSALFYSVIASVFYPGNISDFLGFLGRSITIIFIICLPSVYLADKEHKLKKAINFKNKLEQPASDTIDEKQSPNNEPKSTMEMFKNYKFWLLFLITGLLASLGQMYIYSVGYIVKSLVTYSIATNQLQIDHSSTTTSSLSSDTYLSQDKIDLIVQQEQQIQVGLISIANCIGRIVSGILGDIISQSFQKPRSWLLFIPSIGLAMNQILNHIINNYSSLSINSFLIGLNYGFTFCIMPIVIGDLFGMKNFSLNWGIISLSPIIPAYFFISYFGKEYDLNSSKLTVMSTNSTIKSSICSIGNKCYNKVFQLTFFAGILSVVLIFIFNFGHFKRKNNLLSLQDLRSNNLHVEKPK